MAGPRQLVSPPVFSDRAYGLLSVVQARYDEPDQHWRNGITWQDLCGMAGTTVDPFCTDLTVSSKIANFTTPVYGAQPFTVFGEVDCSPVGYSQQEQRARALDALGRAESWQVERTFWTGSAAATGNMVYPHLAANTAVYDPNIATIQLQCAATAVSGSVILDIVEGVGRLEAAMANCYNGQPTIHVPKVLGPQLGQWGVVKADGGVLKTLSGSLVALGAGYTGSGPDGTIPSNAVWIYATPPVIAYRSGMETFAFRESLDRTTNTVKTIAERTYVLGFSCCCFYALPVSLGGDITGQPLSAF